jgi:hypothetical protein
MKRGRAVKIACAAPNTAMIHRHVAQPTSEFRSRGGAVKQEPQSQSGALLHTMTRSRGYDVRHAVEGFGQRVQRRVAAGGEVAHVHLRGQRDIVQIERDPCARHVPQRRRLAALRVGMQKAPHASHARGIADGAAQHTHTRLIKKPREQVMQFAEVARHHLGQVNAPGEVVGLT